MQSKLFSYSLDVMNLVVKQGVTFFVAIKNLAYTKKLDEKSKGDVSALCGSALRHYRVFEMLIAKQYETLDDDLKHLSMLFLANKLFVKRFNEAKLIEDLKGEFFTKEVIFADDFFENISLESLNLFSDEEKNTHQGWAVRNNLPDWLVGM